MAYTEEELKSLLMRMKEESEKAALKLNIQRLGIWSHHFMTNIKGKNKTVADCIFFGSKITAGSR